MFDFLGSIGDVISSIEGAILAALVQILNFFIALFQIIFSVLSAIAQFFATVLGKVGAFFHALWDTVIKGVLAAVWGHIRDAVNWLSAHIAPIVHLVQRIRDYIDRFYRLYILPEIRLIQQIRGYLRILALLHIKIAAELDAKLAAYQAQLTQTFAAVRATLNAAIDIGNAIVDPSYLIRKPALLLSIRRQIPALAQALTGRPPGYWFPSPRGAQGGAFAPSAGAFGFAGGSWSVPPSDYLSDDAGVGDVTGFATDFLLDNSAVDSAGPLDYFNDDLYPLPACDDPAACLTAQLNAIVAQPIADVGVPI